MSSGARTPSPVAKRQGVTRGQEDLKRQRTLFGERDADGDVIVPDVPAASPPNPINANSHRSQIQTATRIESVLRGCFPDADISVCPVEVPRTAREREEGDTRQALRELPAFHERNQETSFGIAGLYTPYAIVDTHGDVEMLERILEALKEETRLPRNTCWSALVDGSRIGFLYIDLDCAEWRKVAARKQRVGDIVGFDLPAFDEIKDMLLEAVHSLVYIPALRDRAVKLRALTEQEARDWIPLAATWDASGFFKPEEFKISAHTHFVDPLCAFSCPADMLEFVRGPLTQQAEAIEAYAEAEQHLPFSECDQRVRLAHIATLKFGNNDRFDTTVYRKNPEATSKMRLAGQCKPHEENRRLKPALGASVLYTAWPPLLRHTMCHPMPDELEDIKAQPWWDAYYRVPQATAPNRSSSRPSAARALAPQNDSAIAHLLDLLNRTELGIGDGSCYRVRSCNDDGFIIVNRVRSAYCNLCKRTHDNDNAALEIRGDMLTVMCFRPPYARRRIDLATVLMREPDAQRREQLRQELCGRQRSVPQRSNALPTMAATGGVTIRGNDVSIDAKKVAEEDLALYNVQATTDDLPPNAILDALASGTSMLYGVRAPTGAGKTHWILEQVKQIPGTCVAWMTPRRTLAGGIKARSDAMEAGFELYLDLPAGRFHIKDHPHVVVQLESLWRVDSRGTSDNQLVVVLDEIQALLAQFDSDTMNKNSCATETCAMFQWLIDKAAVVIPMDAHLQSRHLQVLENFRQEPFDNVQVFAQALPASEQTFPVPLVTVVDQMDIATAKREIMRRLSEGQPVNVMTNYGVTFAEDLAKDIKTAFPGTRVRMIHSKTPTDVKEAFNLSPDDALRGYTVLICTPSVTVGVDIQTPFRYVIGVYHRNRPLEAVQQLRRVRNVEEMLVFIIGGHSEGQPPARGLAFAQQCPPEQIPRSVPQYRLSRDTGEREFDEQNPFFKMWLANSDDVIRGEQDFVPLLLRYLDFGKQVKFYCDPQSAGIEVASADANKATNASQHEIDMQQCRQVAEARQLSQDEFNELRGNRSPEDEAAVEQFFLRLRYDVPHDFVLTAEHVARYRLSKKPSGNGALPPHTVAKNLQDLRKAAKAHGGQRTLQALVNCLEQIHTNDVRLKKSHTATYSVPDNHLVRVSTARTGTVAAVDGLPPPRRWTGDPMAGHDATGTFTDKEAQTHGFADDHHEYTRLALDLLLALGCEDIAVLSGNSRNPRMQPQYLRERTIDFANERKESIAKLYPGLKTGKLEANATLRQVTDFAKGILRPIDLKIIAKRRGNAMRYVVREGGVFQPTKKSPALPRPFAITPPGGQVPNSSEVPTIGPGTGQVPTSGPGAGQVPTSGVTAIRLPNLGNTCFLNAALQLLLHTPGAVDQEGPLQAALQKMRTAADEGIRDILGLFPSLNDRRQHDFSEALDALLTYLPVRAHFVIDLRDSNGDTTRPTELRVPVGTGGDLKELLSSYLQDMRVSIYRPPHELVVITDRTREDASQGVNRAAVSLPQTIVLQEVRYELVGAAHWFGASASEGHYTWTARTAAGDWVCLSDDAPIQRLNSINDNPSSTCAAHYRRE